MATATVFKSICYYGKMMHNRISGVTMALYHDLNFMGHLNITWCGVPFLMKFSTFWWENRPFLYESHLIFRPLTAPAITTAVHKSLRPWLSWGLLMQKNNNKIVKFSAHFCGKLTKFSPIFFQSWQNQKSKTKSDFDIFNILLGVF